MSYTNGFYRPSSQRDRWTQVLLPTMFMWATHFGLVPNLPVLPWTRWSNPCPVRTGGPPLPAPLSSQSPSSWSDMCVEENHPCLRLRVTGVGFSQKFRCGRWRSNLGNGLGQHMGITTFDPFSGVLKKSKLSLECFVAVLKKSDRVFWFYFIFMFIAILTYVSTPHWNAKPSWFLSLLDWSYPLKGDGKGLKKHTKTFQKCNYFKKKTEKNEEAKFAR